MKKLVLLLVIVALAFMLSGATCLGKVQDVACNPPENVIDVANIAAPILVTALNLAVPGTTAYINAVNAQQVVTAIQAGTCVSVTQINALISFIQSIDFQKAQAKTLAMRGDKAPARPVSVEPLKKWAEIKN